MLQREREKERENSWRKKIKENNNERKTIHQSCKSVWRKLKKKRKKREKIKKMTVERNKRKKEEKRKGEEKDLETNVGPLRWVVSSPEFLKELSGHSENNDDSNAVREWFRRHPPNGPHYEGEMLENNRETIEMIENNSCSSWK